MWHAGDEPVPGYRLESFLGRGSNAEVWRASAPGGTLAALKFVGLDRKLGLKEYRGIRRVKEIRHAHLLPIMACWILGQDGDVLEDCALDGEAEPAPRRDLPITGTLQIQPIRRDSPKTLVVAMLLGGKGLHEVLHDRQQAGHEGIPVDELLQYMGDAARGLDYLNSPRHDLGAGPVAIQHCDVKPQNILLVGDSAMVCDFGLARVLGGSDVCRTITGPAGTPAYVAPECIRNATPSPTSDQYSLAVTYFELRTGRLPFAGESLAEVYAAHTRGELVLDALPQAERRVIARATSLSPEQRHPSNIEMVRALHRAVEEQRHFVSAAEAVASASAAAAAIPRSVAPGRADAVLPDAVAQDHEDRQTTDTDVPSESTSLDGLNLPADSAGAGQGEQPGGRPMQTYVLQFEPASAEVVIDGARQRLDAEGRVEIRTHTEARLDVTAAAPGFEPFRKSLAVAALEWPTAKIVLRRDARALVDRGVAHLKEGNVDAAIADFDEAIDLAPDLAEAYYGRAMAHGATPEYRRNCAAAFNEQAHEEFARGEYHRAAADFSKALELNPELATLDRCRLLRNRALAYRKQGLYAEAIADYDRVIGCCPDFAKVYRDRAAAIWDKGDHDRAIGDYGEAMRLAPDDDAGDYRRDCGAAHRARGDVHWQRGDAVRALADYDEAIRLRPDWGIAYNQRGRVRAAGHDFDGALADYSRAIELDPEFAHLYLYNRGSARLAAGDGDGAIADLTAAIELKPDYRKAYVRRSEAYKATGREAEAGDDVLRAKALE